MNAKVRNLLDKVIAEQPNSKSLKGLLQVANEEKKLVVYIYTKLKTKDNTLYKELKSAKEKLTLYESGIVLQFFLDLVTKYPSLKEFVPALLSEVVL